MASLRAQRSWALELQTPEAKVILATSQAYDMSQVFIVVW